MHGGRFDFAQLMNHLPPYGSQECAACHKGNYKFRGIFWLDQFLCLAIAQLTFREGLRDIEACLRAVEGGLYHAGFRGKVARSTRAGAIEAHDWRVYPWRAQEGIRMSILRARNQCARTLAGWPFQYSLRHRGA